MILKQTIGLFVLHPITVAQWLSLTVEQSSTKGKKKKSQQQHSIKVDKLQSLSCGNDGNDNVSDNDLSEKGGERPRQPVWI